MIAHPPGARLRSLLAGERLVRLVGVNDGYSAMLAERHGFEALWASGLGISAAHGVPDASIATMTEFLQVAQILERATTLPVIADCDTGFGDANVLTHMVECYERAGIAAVCIEDKLFPKRNSFTSGQALEDAHVFATKICCATDARKSSDFMILARVESFIAGAGLTDAMHRASLYEEAGADALVIHSKRTEPSEIREFVMHWRLSGHRSPVFVIPTTFPAVTVPELEALGVDAVIYANHALRAALLAIDRVLGWIAEEGTTLLADADIASVADVLELVGTDEVNRRDSWFEAEVERRRKADRRLTG
jgi:phosphoenolpyruvate phosphomutase